MRYSQRYMHAGMEMCRGDPGRFQTPVSIANGVVYATSYEAQTDTMMPWAFPATCPSSPCAALWSAPGAAKNNYPPAIVDDGVLYLDSPNGVQAYAPPAG